MDSHQRTTRGHDIMKRLLTTRLIGVAGALLLASCMVRSPESDTSRPSAEVRRSFSFGYWPDGWRKVATDTSPDALAFETGYYGFLLNMDDLANPRFGLFDDDVDYQSALQTGTRGLAGLQPAELNIELETGGSIYRAVTCKSGTAEGVQRLKHTRLWESGRYVQHFDVQDLVFKDAEGNKLSCYGDLHLVGWPGSLTLTTELMPDLVYSQGLSEGVSGPGVCIVDSPLDVPHDPSLEPTDLTVECWFKLPEGMEGEDGWVLCKNGNEWEEGCYGFLLTHNGKKASAYMNIGGGSKHAYHVYQRGELRKNEWAHLALTYDGSTMSFYVNGQLQNTHEIGKVRVPGKGLLRLGRRGDGLFGIAKGLYDQVRVWNRALSPGELAAHTKAPATLSTRAGLVYERDFDNLEAVSPSPVWTDATLRMSLKAGESAWSEEAVVPGEWRKGDKKKFSLACNIQGARTVDDSTVVRVRTANGQQTFPVKFVEKINCRQTLVENYTRSWQGGTHADGGAGNNYDEFLIEVENSGTAAQRVPFQFRMPRVPGVTGFVPLLCEEDGTPTGIPVQLSKNWHNPQENGLFGYMFLPAEPGLTTYLLRIVYGFYGTIPSASHAQLSLVGWGLNGRWDQLAIGSWGEVFCLDMDMSPTEVAITDVRGLYLRNGKDGDKWGWSDGGWGGDWLRVQNTEGEKLAFSEMKTAYLAHGPCLTDVHYDGAYGPGPEVDLQATVRMPRVDDHARTFNTLRYTFNEEVSTEGAWLYKMGGGWFVSPKIAYGNREGLIAEHDVPQTGLKAGDVLRDPVTLTGDGPWWVAYPGGHIGDGRTWGTGSRSLIIRGYRASFGGRVVENPTIAFPVNDRKFKEGQTDINLLLVPPTNVAAFLPGDFVELDTEWIVVPRVADDYYGPNETFRKHLAENPRSWKTVHRAAVGNNLEINVAGGEPKHRYPIIIETTKPEITVDIKGGLGYVPIRFDGLATADGYALFEVVDGEEKPLDQSRHGNDFWQTDYDAASGTYRITFNIPLDGKPASRWVLKREVKPIKKAEVDPFYYHGKKPDTMWAYKQANGKALQMHVFLPSNYAENKTFPTILFFHGGSWNAGAPSGHYPDCVYWSKRGMIAASVGYRLRTRDNVQVPLECVKDAKSAIRFLRENAKRLKVDPDRIVAAGGSAGGQLAAATAMITDKESNDDVYDLSISCVPNAVVGFNPWFRCQPELNPATNVKSGLPPTIVFLGTKDPLPVPEMKSFHEKMVAAGNASEFYVGHGAGHGFCVGLNPHKPFSYWSVGKTDRFLVKHGILKGQDNLQRPAGLKQVSYDAYVVPDNAEH